MLAVPVDPRQRKVIGLGLVIGGKFTTLYLSSDKHKYSASNSLLPSLPEI